MRSRALLPLLFVCLLSATASRAAVDAAVTNSLSTTNPPGWLTQPMSLIDAINIALSQNAAIQKALADMEIAHGVAIQLRAISWPKLRGGSGYIHTEATEEFPFTGPGGVPSSRVNPPEDSWSGSIRIVQSIYQGGRMRAAWRSARLTKEQALLEYYMIVANNLLDVRAAYYAVLLAEQQILVREASVKLLAEELENTKRRFEAGTVPRFDVLRGEVAVANARPRLIRAKNAHRIAKNDLATLLGYKIPANIWEDIPMNLTGKLAAEPYDFDLPSAISIAVQRRPEIGALHKLASIRKEGIKMAKADSMPFIDLFGGYEARNSTFENDFFSSVAGPMAGVELTWDIWDGNLTRGRVKEAEARYDRVTVELADTFRRVEQEVRTTYSRLVEAREVLESQKKVQEQADEALRLAISRYEAGTGTQLDVLDAQTALTEARATQVEALHDYALARARLHRALGQDVPETVISPKLETPTDRQPKIER